MFGAPNLRHPRKFYTIAGCDGWDIKKVRMARALWQKGCKKVDWLGWWFDFKFKVMKQNFQSVIILCLVNPPLEELVKT